MTDELVFETVSVPVLDTGLGRELGYADDAELRRVAEAERAALPPAVRALLDEVERRLAEAVIGSAERGPRHLRSV